MTREQLLPFLANQPASTLAIEMGIFNDQRAKASNSSKELADCRTADAWSQSGRDVRKHCGQDDFEEYTPLVTGKGGSEKAGD